MPRYKVAHVKEQGVDLIIVPVDRSFGTRTTADQNAATAGLQAAASSAGLAGTVVPVWDAGGGRMGFLAPSQWHAFFKSTNLGVVASSINREIYW